MTKDQDPDHEEGFHIQNEKNQKAQLFIQLFDIDHKTISGDHPNGSPPDRGETIINSYESRVFFDDFNGLEREIKDEASKAILIDLFIGETRIINEIIPKIE